MGSGVHRGFPLLSQLLLLSATRRLKITEVQYSNQSANRYLHVVEESPLIRDRRQLAELPRELEAEVRRVVHDRAGAAGLNRVLEEAADDGVR